MAEEQIQQQERMSDLDTELPAVADDIMAMLDKEAATDRPRDETGKFVAQAKESEAPSEGEEPEAEADDAAPEEASGEEVEAEPETAIEPPASWTADAKEHFAKLPPDLQKYVSERESDREKGINAKLSEAAEARKKYDAAEQATAQERQQYAENLTKLYQFQQVIDPVLADGNQTDWAKLRRDDPAGYVQKWGDYQERIGLMNAVGAEIQRISHHQAEELKANHARRLNEVFPEFANPETGRTLRDGYVPTLKDAGYTAEEIEQGWGALHYRDPRDLKILDKAAKYDKLMAERKTIGDKKVAPQPGKVVKPRGADTGASGKSAHIAALEKRAKSSHRMSDQVDYILAIANERPSR